MCGVLGETYGWKYGFGAAGLGMLAGLAMFIWGQKYLHGHAEPPAPEALRERVFGLPREWAIYLGAMLGLAPIARPDVGDRQRRLHPRHRLRPDPGADADAAGAGVRAGLVRLVHHHAVHARSSATR